jgi:hypothetical protein
MVSPKGEITHPGSVWTLCPNAGCKVLFFEMDGGHPYCPDCHTSFYADGNGRHIGCNGDCPKCGESMASWLPEATVTCHDCGWTFSMDTTGVVAGFHVACPACETSVQMDTAGDVVCPMCSCPFSVDATRKIIDRYVCCPRCEADAFHHVHGGKAWCSECEHRFEVDANGNVAFGFVVDCPLCPNIRPLADASAAGRNTVFERVWNAALAVVN